MSVKIEYKKFGEFLVCDKHCLNADVCKAKYDIQASANFCRLFKDNRIYRKQTEGEWKMGEDEEYEYGTCSVCGYNEYNAFSQCLPHNFCPNCGAKMKGAKQ
jgi:hypothetical protein